MKNQFLNLITKNTDVFDSVVAAMDHEKKEEARPFLLLMDSIINYYLRCDIGDNDENKIIYPIVYIPHAPLWAREVLARFLIIKLSLYYNEDTRSIMKDSVSPDKVNVLITNEDTKRYKKFTNPRNAYVRSILPKLSDDFIGETKHKNMIFCGESDVKGRRTGNNRFISEFYGTVDDVFTDMNLIMCQNIDADCIKNQFRIKKELPMIDNLFVFFTNNNMTNSLERTAIERWNKAYHIGVKNCFVFDFSDDPFRVNYTLQRKIALCRKFPMITGKDAWHYQHFVTFNESETNLLFNRKPAYQHEYFADDQLMFTDVLGSLLENAEYRIQERNLFSLSLSQELLDIYKLHLGELFPECCVKDYQFSFDWQIEMAKSKIIPCLNNIVKQAEKRSCRSIAVVIDKNTPESTKKALRSLFKSFLSQLVVKFYDYSALKARQGKNSIAQEFVIILQYRPHYVRESFAKYPNSFDPFVVNDGQFIFDIIQGVAFDDMYQWDKFEYDKSMCDLLCCEYRAKVLGLLDEPRKPDVRRAIGEKDFSDERNDNRPVAYVRGNFEDGMAFSISETELVIVELDGEMKMARLGDLRDDSQLLNVTKIQVLDSIVDELKGYISKMAVQTNLQERTVRNIFFQNRLISHEERDSDVELWRILLRHKIEEYGLEKVYGSVMNDIKESERIQIGQFKRWSDMSVDMILPLQRVTQRKLFEYLGFAPNSPYLSIMRNKKAAQKNGTQQFNNMVNQFLLSTLFCEINNDKYDEFYDSEINDLLNVRKFSDFEFLMQILRKKICPKIIQNIE